MKSRVLGGGNQITMFRGRDRKFYREFKPLKIFSCIFLVIVIKSCADSVHGCCPDGKTAAQGPDQAGCPSKLQFLQLFFFKSFVFRYMQTADRQHYFILRWNNILSLQLSKTRASVYKLNRQICICSLRFRSSS